MQIASATAQLPLYILNVTYPLIPDEIARFCAGKRAVLVVEEGQPEFIEQALCSVLHQRAGTTRIVGKEILPMAGEYTGDVLKKGIGEFLDAVVLRAARSRRLLQRRVPRPHSFPPAASQHSCLRGPRGFAPAVRNARFSPRSSSCSASLARCTSAPISAAIPSPHCRPSTWATASWATASARRALRRSAPPPIAGGRRHHG